MAKGIPQEVVERLQAEDSKVPLFIPTRNGLSANQEKEVRT